MISTVCQVSLVVNVASECGYTDLNYRELVQLQTDYQDKGLTVLAFPCNQFGQQEPGTSQQVLRLATQTYGANFPIFGKVDVTGDSACAAYKYLAGNMGSVPSWNFCKYLVDQKGKVVQFFPVTSKFDEIRTSIDYLLRKVSSSNEL